MQDMRTLLGILVLAVIALGGYWLLQGGSDLAGNSPATTTPQTEGISGTRSYTSTEYGISFTYPARYVLAERDAEGSAQRKHHIITLTDEEYVPPVAGEGPTAITIEMFQNDIDKQTTEGWIRNSSNSNFKLSLDNKLSSTTVAGQSALSYTWDGLYRGDTIAIARPAYVYAFSVTYQSPEDAIRNDFNALIAGTVFQ